MWKEQMRGWVTYTGTRYNQSQQLNNNIIKQKSSILVNHDQIKNICLIVLSCLPRYAPVPRLAGLGALAEDKVSHPATLYTIAPSANWCSVHLDFPPLRIFFCFNFCADAGGGKHLRLVVLLRLVPCVLVVCCRLFINPCLFYLFCFCFLLAVIFFECVSSAVGTWFYLPAHQRLRGCDEHPTCDICRF